MRQPSSRSRHGTVALVAATLAIPAQILSLCFLGEALGPFRRPIVDGRPAMGLTPHPPYQLAGVWLVLGVLLILVAIVCWAAAAWRGLAMPRLRLIILLVANLILAMLIP